METNLKNSVTQASKTRIAQRQRMRLQEERINREISAADSQAYLELVRMIGRQKRLRTEIVHQYLSEQGMEMIPVGFLDRQVEMQTQEALLNLLERDTTLLQRMYDRLRPAIRAQMVSNLKTFLKGK